MRGGIPLLSGIVRLTLEELPEFERRYATASIVSAERIVFNIKGNDFRLVAAVDFGKTRQRISWHRLRFR